MAYKICQNHQKNLPNTKWSLSKWPKFVTVVPKWWNFAKSGHTGSRSCSYLATYYSRLRDQQDHIFILQKLGTWKATCPAAKVLHGPPLYKDFQAKMTYHRQHDNSQGIPWKFWASVIDFLAVKNDKFYDKWWWNSLSKSLSNKNVHCVTGIQTSGCRMEFHGESTRLWALAH